MVELRRRGRESESEKTISSDVLRSICSELGVTGAQVGLLKSGVTELHSLGFARRGPDQSMTHQTGVQVGSITKLFNAALVLQLAQSRMLDLDEPVGTYLPELRLAAWEGVPAERLITPRMLLSMTSGLDNGPYSDMGSSDVAVDRAVNLIAHTPLTFAPGSAWGYSNASANIGGLLVERLTGMRWESALESRLLRPCGLADTTTSLRRQVLGPTAVGYLTSGGHPQLIPMWTIGRGFAPAGSTLTSTASDLLRFARVLMDGGVAESGERILAAATLDDMMTRHTPLPNNIAEAWGLGPQVRTLGGAELYGHGGRNVAGGGQLQWIPAFQVAVAVVCNVPAVAEEFSRRVLDYIYTDLLSVAPPAPRAHIEGPGWVPAEYVGTFERSTMKATVTADGHDLKIRLDFGANSDIGKSEPGGCEEYRLLPLGDDQFRPVSSDGTYPTIYDFAFVRDASGAVCWLHDPFAAARRVREPAPGTR